MVQKRPIWYGVLGPINLCLSIFPCDFDKDLFGFFLGIFVNISKTFLSIMGQISNLAEIIINFKIIYIGITYKEKAIL